MLRSSSDKTMQCLIDGDPASFWEGQAKGANWVIVSFERTMQFSRFRFQSPHDGKHDPTRNVLYVAVSSGMPKADSDWRVVCQFTTGTPDPQDPSLYLSPVFQATGQIWKWDIVERAGGSIGAHVTEIGFQVSEPVNNNNNNDNK